MMNARAALYNERRQSVAQATKVKEDHGEKLLKLNNVIGAGVGYKITKSRPTDEICVVVAVTRKLSKDQLDPADLVPPLIDGFRTDVIETGRLRALSSRIRPAQPGCSLGHFESTAGTLGCLVERDGKQFILSNNHVLAMMNQAEIGDPILQPGPADGGRLTDQIATLADFVPIDFGKEEADCRFTSVTETLLNFLAELSGSAHRLQSIKLTQGVNRVDAALALPLEPDIVIPTILEIGTPQGVSEATLGSRVKKTGRTTGFTTGTIQIIELTVQVSYDGSVATFEGQFMATPMSRPGDSGSAVLDLTNCVIGLLFAGSDQATIINPIEDVLNALGVKVVTGP